ncbi:hypothetical protein CsSME_00012454 [Camellia sinensis var. sinensis]
MLYVTMVSEPLSCHICGSKAAKGHECERLGPNPLDVVVRRKTCSKWFSKVGVIESLG